MYRIRIALAVVLATSSTAYAGPEWTEPGDAGSTLPDSQTPMGMGPMAGIKGSLDGAAARGIRDFEDVYRIAITDAKLFSAFIGPNANGTPTFDTQLWLFNRFGEGILANDNNPAAGANGESGFSNASDDGTGSSVQNNGIYFLAISGAGNAPRSALNDRLFIFMNPTEVSGPDGSASPLDRWTGPGAIGEYTVFLTGVSFLEPGAAADFNSDGCVDSTDLAILLAAWGTDNRADLNLDGATDSDDLAILLANWGCLPV